MKKGFSFCLMNTFHLWLIRYGRGGRRRSAVSFRFFFIFSFRFVSPGKWQVCVFLLTEHLSQLCKFYPFWSLCVSTMLLLCLIILGIIYKLTTQILISPSRENKLLWREVALLRQKHHKQQQIVNKVICFFTNWFS